MVHILSLACNNEVLRTLQKNGQACTNKQTGNHSLSAQLSISISQLIIVTILKSRYAQTLFLKVLVLGAVIILQLQRLMTMQHNMNESNHILIKSMGNAIKIEQTEFCQKTSKNTSNFLLSISSLSIMLGIQKLDCHYSHAHLCYMPLPMCYLPNASKILL